jgi:hypothetical protein
MYQLLKDKNGNNACVNRLSDNAYIPMNEQNTDYQEYLKWVAEGNEPIPADE